MEKQKEGVVKYQRLREEVDELYSKLNQIESDRNEHDLVIRSLAGVEGGRRCWHQVGAVLAEKKVGDVLPILTQNRDQLTEAAKTIMETIEKKDKDMAEVQRKYGIIVRPAK